MRLYHETARAKVKAVQEYVDVGVYEAGRQAPVLGSGVMSPCIWLTHGCCCLSPSAYVAW
jgi:hypothetical protein